MRRMLLALSAIAMIGCGGDSTGVVASAEGTWNLQTVNGAPLPFTLVFVANPVYKLEIVSDQIVAHADGTYSEAFTSRETDGATVTTTTDNDTGTWVQHNASLTITASDGSSQSAAISGNTITLNLDGVVAVFKRQ